MFSQSPSPSLASADEPGRVPFWVHLISLRILPKQSQLRSAMGTGTWPWASKWALYSMPRVLVGPLQLAGGQPRVGAFEVSCATTGRVYFSKLACGKFPAAGIFPSLIAAVGAHPLSIPALP